MSTRIRDSAVATFRSQKKLAEGAIAQVSDAELHVTPGPDGNCIAVIVRHMAGNMVSRWTDFLTTDGEKPSRDRDAEFVDAPGSRAEIMERWERGWAALFRALESLSDADLERTITIRGEPHSVIEAIHRQMSHYGYHVGQIVFAAHLFRGTAWRSLSIPRGESAAFEQKLRLEGRAR